MSFSVFMSVNLTKSRNLHYMFSHVFVVGPLCAQDSFQWHHSIQGHLCRDAEGHCKEP